MIDFAPGMRTIIRDEEWMVKKIETNSLGNKTLYCVGVSPLVKDREAIFLTDLEKIQIVDPAEVKLVADVSPFYKRALLYLESQWRQQIPTDANLHIGHKAAMDLMPYQLDPAKLALQRQRQRILIADAVGLGKTLEAGILMSELIARGKGKRILVVTVKSMMTQFQKEMWNRFTIPLVRLDSNRIQKIRANLPSNYNPFFYYDKTIVFRDFPGKEFELEVFNRYNKGTKALTPQEIRNAVYASPHNEHISDFVKQIYEGDSERDKKLRNIFNVSKDRLLKKKVHEGIFSILYVLEYGIQEEFKDSTTYATEYMKKKSNFCNNSTEEEIMQDLNSMRALFENYLNWLLECTKYTPYPISKEFYGISSKQYKFSTSMALVLTALYKKVYIDIGSNNLAFDDVILKMKTCLIHSFLEDSSYSASSTNSREIEKLIDNFTI